MTGDGGRDDTPAASSAEPTGSAESARFDPAGRIPAGRSGDDAASTTSEADGGARAGDTGRDAARSRSAATSAASSSKAAVIAPSSSSFASYSDGGSVRMRRSGGTERRTSAAITAGDCFTTPAAASTSSAVGVRPPSPKTLFDRAFSGRGDDGRSGDFAALSTRSTAGAENAGDDERLRCDGFLSKLAERDGDGGAATSTRAGERARIVSSAAARVARNDSATAASSATQFSPSDTAMAASVVREAISDGVKRSTGVTGAGPGVTSAASSFFFKACEKDENESVGGVSFQCARNHSTPLSLSSHLKRSTWFDVKCCQRRAKCRR